jgi:hypothetical protein
LIHVIAVIVCYAHYGQAHCMFESNSPEQFPVTQPPGWGYSLPIVYFSWAFVVIALYPLCNWYAGLKQRSGNPWSAISEPASFKFWAADYSLT